MGQSLTCVRSNSPTRPRPARSLKADSALRESDDKTQAAAVVVTAWRASLRSTVHDPSHSHAHTASISNIHTHTNATSGATASTVTSTNNDSHQPFGSIIGFTPRPLKRTVMELDDGATVKQRHTNTHAHARRPFPHRAAIQADGLTVTIHGATTTTTDAAPVAVDETYSSDDECASGVSSCQIQSHSQSPSQEPSTATTASPLSPSVSLSPRTVLAFLMTSNGRECQLTLEEETEAELADDEFDSDDDSDIGDEDSESEDSRPAFQSHHQSYQNIAAFAGSRDADSECDEHTRAALAALGLPQAVPRLSTLRSNSL